ncbi:DUF309 domain-containing protein [Staphylococcus agnetis]|uniref:DUF309 domain-containing protein n=1 Tax=Staphylococcus agnetis TaxID=985762 RepID=UPI00399436B3
MIHLHQQLMEFYVQFHQKQHYFLCHDILEEAWKAQPTFSKDDPVVALILLATACYHHRRGNFKGAHRSYKKALTVCRHHDKLTYQALGVDYHQFENELRQLIESTEQKERYTPIVIPLTVEMTQNILHHYPNYHLLKTVISSPYILHHHKLRNRDDVIEARARALQNKKR